MIKEKANRHQAIHDLLEGSKISSQEELREKLVKLGFETTQATLSRDLAALQVIKIPDPEKGYIYTNSEQPVSRFSVLEDNSPLHMCNSIAFSNNLAVIRCMPSFAPSIGLILDRLDLDAIIGTIAGDDTVLVIIREGISHEQFKELLVNRLPELRGRI
jgi:transcriptional regulator of arginine metabolism